MPGGPAYYKVLGTRMVKQAIRRLAARPSFHVSRPPEFADRKTIRIDSSKASCPARSSAPSTHELDRFPARQLNSRQRDPAQAINGPSTLS
jgi:hypothetical protein